MFPIFSRPSSSTTLLSLWQRQNAVSPIDFTLPGIEIPAREAQSRNARSATFVMVSGIDTDVMAVFSNTLLPIARTATPLTMLGISMSVTPFNSTPVNVPAASTVNVGLRPDGFHTTLSTQPAVSTEGSASYVANLQPTHTLPEETSASVMLTFSSRQSAEPAHSHVSISLPT